MVILKIRNKAIANIFSQMGLVEAWGSGIKRIFNAAKEYALPEPKFQEFDNMFRVELFRNSFPMASEIKHRRSIGKVWEKHGMVELNRTQQEIVKLLLENTRTEALVQDRMDKLIKTEWIVCPVCGRKNATTKYHFIPNNCYFVTF